MISVLIRLLSGIRGRLQAPLGSRHIKQRNFAP
jgi:hypothetical protein